jgi:hypothetical protein
MPIISTTVDCLVHDSFRVQQVAGLFDLPVAARSHETFSAELPGNNQSWTIGAIVGPSGSGKSTLARAAFGDCVYTPTAWPTDRAIVDCLGDGSIQEITRVLTAVGLGSPPAWVKPYHVLSGGEKFRCDLARALLAQADLVVFDESPALSIARSPSSRRLPSGNRLNMTEIAALSRSLATTTCWSGLSRIGCWIWRQTPLPGGVFGDRNYESKSAAVRNALGECLPDIII